jgi:hypothetical protein
MPAREDVSAGIGEAWTFTPEDDNTLVLTTWKASEVSVGDANASPDLDDSAWQDVVAGAWAYQLPAEPEGEWPHAVWYRIPFDVTDVPDRLALLVDGFLGDDPRVWLNGDSIEFARNRSRLDAQMFELDLSGSVRAGKNVLAVKLTLRDATGGLVDNLKIVGSFALEGDETGGYRLAIPPEGAEARTWTEQGFPFYSGRGVYRTTFEHAASSERVYLKVPMYDDVLEVEVNGSSAGVRLWDPYVVEITDLIKPGSNELALRVANTPANMLNANIRPSGIAGPPSLLISQAAREPESVTAT